MATYAQAASKKRPNLKLARAEPDTVDLDMEFLKPTTEQSQPTSNRLDLSGLRLNR